MSHLASFRKGWESENLTRFILSKFSFVAHPATVSDDIGSDFFCTLFQIRREGNHDYLIPRNSFAIQIKSDKEALDVSNKLEYLSDLEIPFLVGVVDRDDLRLTIHSGEYIPMFFSHIGPQRIKRLEIELCERFAFDLRSYFTESGKGNYVLKFPRIVDIEADIGPEELKATVDTLCEVCSLIHGNIASRRNQEYVFDISGSEPPSVIMFAGTGSVRVFRENFLKRFAEVFYNLEWIHKNMPKKFKAEEFRIYSSFLDELARYYSELPLWLLGPFHSLKDRVERST